MHAWESIQETVDYIEDNIRKDIEINELASIAKLSPFYYQRLFTRLIKKPVREYIKLRKLARASIDLKNKKKLVSIVSLEYGFLNHETFTRAFKNTYGITPLEYRKKDLELDNFEKPDLLLNYVMVDEGVPLITEGLVLEYNKMTLDKEIRFIGVTGYFKFESGKMSGERPGISGPALIWKNFFEEKNKIPNKKEPRMIGVSYHGDAKDGYSTYFCGIEPDLNYKNSKLDQFILPVREYLVCRFEAQSLYELTTVAMSKVMKHTRFWLREHGLRADGFFPEIYPHIEKNDVIYMELWIPFIKR
ncbi:Transcriptional regulator, AraC [Alteracholeplasma palmae J233]|uniref:Transcriptional regulator, AraC n=1 Tax=Alteracholeplasma palmae (strain ATCC 49389 / J233) TaxID=1318466 RepID=U4KS60_ALTPJ|nr:AraC family transcriptional regulator [Alteracholeplasma palmae]CCV64751.1 Transcriptional regulator, AraC [Alteracholeplasma palmae J233]